MNPSTDGHMADGIDADGLAGKIAAALRGMGGSSGDDEDYGSRPRSVPYDRLQREIDLRKRAEAALAELQPQVEALAQAHEGALGKVREDTAAELKRIQGIHREDLLLVDAGVTDPLGRQAVRTAWANMDKEGRGKSAAEWFGGLVEAHKAHTADPDKVEAPQIPRTLQAYLPTGEAFGQALSGQQQRRRQPVTGPERRSSAGVDGIPIDQGMDAFFAGLRGVR